MSSFAQTAISSPDMIRTIVQLHEDQAAALEQAARRRGISKAAVIREALDALLVRETQGSAVERALKAAGAGTSGVEDLAERHDEYLTDVTPA